MLESWSRKWITTPLFVLYALWVLLFYQLVFTAWTLEYSFYGVLGVLIASAIFVYAFPREDRKTLMRFTLFVLMVSIGFASFDAESLPWQIVDYVVLLILALVLGRFVIKIKATRLLAVIVALTVLQVWIPLGNIGLLSAFQIRFVGRVNSPDKQVPSIPVALAQDPQRPGKQEIITLRGHVAQKGEAQEMIDSTGGQGPASDNVIKAVQELQNSYDLVVVRPGRFSFHEQSATPADLSQLSSDQLALIDYPFTTPHFIKFGTKVRMYLTLSQNPAQMLSTLLNPGSLASSLSALSIQTQSQVASNWATVTGSKSPVVDGLTISGGYLTGSYGGTSIHTKTAGTVVLGVYPLLPPAVSRTPQAVVEGNNLIQVISLTPGNRRVIATLRGSYLYPLTRDVLFADLTGNKMDELLVNTVPAQIFQLRSDGSWRTLWVSNRSSFRFETVFPEARGDLVIANAPSYYSGAPTRYLGGYHYNNNQLVPVFRSYHVDLVDLHTAYVTSAKAPELLTSTYSHQQIMLLAPSKIPWVDVVEGVYVGLILVGLTRRMARRRVG